MNDTNTNSVTSPSEETQVTQSSIKESQQTVEKLIENVEEVIVGKHEAIEHFMVAVFGRGHILLEDVPGVGKTMMAKSVAQSIEGEFSRVQFTPDLLPTDVTGVNVFNEKTQEFEFQRGPIFGNVVLADEINRAPPKTQSALLEAMEEQQVTVDGETRPVPDPFIVVATQNSVERDRTYDLPAAEIDRFMKKINLGYPTNDEESEVLRRVVGGHPIEEIKPVTTIEEIREIRSLTQSLTVEDSVRDYVSRLLEFTRDQASLGASPRGGIALLQAAQSRALLDGRNYVIPDDIKTEAPYVLPHRIRADPSGSLGGSAATDIVEKGLQRVRPE
ncbi:MAG: AAA family ATPase [Halobacteriaceae archaeon]